MLKWLKEFVQRYDPRPYNYETDEPSDDVPLTWNTFWYNVWKRFYTNDNVFQARMLLQKIFRKDHISDVEIWNADKTMAKAIYKILLAYKNYERHGYPGSYAELEDYNGAYTEEEYAAKKSTGELVGGGAEAWEKDLDKIIKAVEYSLAEFDEGTKLADWYKKYYDCDPHEETDENKSICRMFHIKGEKSGQITFDEEPKLEEGQEFEYYDEHTIYQNSDLMMKAEQDVDEGYKLLGRFWRNIWD